MRKVKQYLAAGTHAVWVLDSDRREVDVCRGFRRGTHAHREADIESPGIAARIFD